MVIHQKKASANMIIHQTKRPLLTHDNSPEKKPPLTSDKSEDKKALNCDNSLEKNFRPACLIIKYSLHRIACYSCIQCLCMLQFIFAT